MYSRNSKTVISVKIQFFCLLSLLRTESWEGRRQGARLGVLSSCRLGLLSRPSQQIQLSFQSKNNVNEKVKTEKFVMSGKFIRSGSKFFDFEGKPGKPHFCKTRWIVERRRSDHLSGSLEYLARDPFTRSSLLALAQTLILRFKWFWNTR